MNLVPRSCARTFLRKIGAPASLFLRHTAFLALNSLALVCLLALGASHAQAQTAGPKANNPNIQAYTIVATPDGSSYCRDATPQEAERMTKAPGKNLRLINHLDEVDRMTNGASANVDNPSLPGLKIFLLATSRLDANPTAKAAFVKAAENWEAVIKTPMTVYIQVDVGTDFFNDGNTYPSGTIGSTSSSLGARNFSDVRTKLLNTASNTTETALYNLFPTSGSIPTDSGNLNSILIATALSRALGFLPADASSTDTSSMPKIGFNSRFNFDYDQSDGISSGLIDFTAVATHEIGHALGFSSQAGSTSTTLRPAVLDLFRFRSGVSDFTTGQRIMTIGGGQVFWAGNANVFASLASSEAGLSTGGPNGSSANGGDGNQSSHWKDDAQSGVHIGIMDPTISSGHREDITANDLAAFNYMGYNLENSVVIPPPAAPPNDNFVNAQLISGCSGSVNGTNDGATKEAGEAVHFPGSNGGVSVWYRWVAPSTGSVTITTQGSSFDTTLGIYTGNSVGGLTTIAESDDVNTQQQILTSTVTFNAVGGTTYRIAVDGYLGSDTGNITLNWNATNCSVPTPQTVQLGQSSYTVSEGIGFLTVTATRTDTTGPATVKYATSDSTDVNYQCSQTGGAVASRKCDYHITVGTLRFGTGEATKQFQISIVDDTYVETSESFTLALSNAVGMTLGTNSSVPVTITDNDVAGAANPITQTSFFVHQLYVDLLSREPDGGSQLAWTNRIDRCGLPGEPPPPCDRVTVAGDGFMGSAEFFDRQFFVIRLYRTGLGRIPVYSDVGDIAYVSGFLTANDLELNKQDLVNEFTNRSEFASQYNGLTNDAFVARLLSTAGVTVPAQVQSDWVTALGGLKTRAQVFREISERPEVTAKYLNEARVVSAYYGFFTRNPDGAYLNYLQRLDAGQINLSDLANAFINAPEYRQRFGPN